MENSYTSVFMYQTPEYKQKINSYRKARFKSTFRINKKMVICMVLFPIALLFALLTNIYMLALPIVIVIIFAFLCRREAFNENKNFLDQWERFLVSQEKDGFVCNSAIYDSYYKCDDLKKRFIFKYDDKEFINIPYSDIKSYDILLDRHKIDQKKLKDVPDPRIRSYILVINCEEDRKIEIGYSNANKYIKLKNSFVFQQFCNTISINRLAKSLDKILYKRSKKDNKEE